MKKIELVDNKLNVELKPGDIILLKSLYSGEYKTTKYKYIMESKTSPGMYLIQRIDEDQTLSLHLGVSKNWFVRGSNETYLMEVEDIGKNS